MTANIGLRLRAPNGAHVIISPTESSTFKIEVVDIIGHAVDRKTFEEAVEWALVNVSALRQQLFAMLGHKPSPTAKQDR